MESGFKRTNARHHDGGFARIDLVVLLALAFLGSGLLLPALRRQKDYSATMVGGSNLKRLTAAWHLYANDNGEKLVPSGDGGDSGKVSTKPAWAGGWLNFDNQNSDNTNTSYLTNPFGQRGGFLPGSTNRSAGREPSHYGGLLGSYESDPLVFRNPNDPSQISAINGRSLPRVRSVSMNLMLGSAPQTNGWASWNTALGYRVFPSLPSFGSVSPSSKFVFIEEHPDSIDDGMFIVDMTTDETGVPTRFVDVPANYASGAFWISFADGRVDLWKFKGPLFQKAYAGPVPIQPGSIWPEFTRPEALQLKRLFEATTSR